MDATQRLEIELPEELAQAVRARVDSGEFASESDVVAAGLALLDERGEPRDLSIDEQLAAGYDAWKADPTAVFSLEDVERRLREQRMQPRK